MLPILAALAPIASLILLGAVLKRSAFLPDSFWPSCERLVYFLLFPSLLVATLATAELRAAELGPLLLVQAGSTLAVSAALLAARPLLARLGSVSGPSFTSVLQGAIRFNTYVALAACAALHGPAGVALCALALAIQVPIANVICVWALVRYGDAAGRAQGPGGERSQLRATVAAVARNPMILSCLAGMALNLAGGPPPVLGPVMDILGKASLPLGLIAVGAGLTFAGVRLAGVALHLSVAVKLLAVPAVVALLARATGVDGLAADILVLAAGLPTASVTYILARQLGGDAPLMAAIATLQTILAAATLPLVLMSLT
ncbi:MAG: AEC family transporter [Alphaproteobacteria bacterium]|nr:AEC family transporter [Alphaproteobacteria bacterium]